MTELQKIVWHLNSDDYSMIEELLIKNKADNFLFLLQSYKNDITEDDFIIRKLNLSKNSFYVLKSRLYEKIQYHIAGDVTASRDDLLKQLKQIPEMCYNRPRVLAKAFLQKLEKDLLFFDMHDELLVVYGALKKIHLYSENYFHYSQLYNKQAALGFNLEKSEEILGEFNRILSRYNFSRSEDLLEKLLFLRKESINYYTLNPSRQIKIIKNILEVQLLIFCKTNLSGELNVLELLRNTEKIIDELPDSSPYKKWNLITDYLYFEHYLSVGQVKLAGDYYETVNKSLSYFLLYSNVCNTPRFLVSKIIFLQESKKIDELILDINKPLNYDPEDLQSKVLIGIYDAIISYYKGNVRGAINELNDIINLYVFKDYFHIALEIKLTLAFFYMHIQDNKQVNTILTSVTRKIKSDKSSKYLNVLDLAKLFSSQTSQNNRLSVTKQKDLFTLFSARNQNEQELLKYLMPELREKYA